MFEIAEPYLPTSEGVVGRADAYASNGGASVSFSTNIVYQGGKFLIDPSEWEGYGYIRLYEFDLRWTIAESETKKEESKLVTLGLLMEALGK